MLKKKKQAWFFKQVDERLAEVQSELKEELQRRELQFLFIVLPGKHIMFWIERIHVKRLPADLFSTEPVEEVVIWSSLFIFTIVDFDIALENMYEFLTNLDEQKDLTHSSAVSDSALLSKKVVSPDLKNL